MMELISKRNNCMTLLRIKMRRGTYNICVAISMRLIVNSTAVLKRSSILKLDSSPN